MILFLHIFLICLVIDAVKITDNNKFSSLLNVPTNGSLKDSNEDTENIQFSQRPRRIFNTDTNEAENQDLEAADDQMVEVIRYRGELLEQDEEKEEKEEGKKEETDWMQSAIESLIGSYVVEIESLIPDPSNPAGATQCGRIDSSRARYCDPDSVVATDLGDIYEGMIDSTKQRTMHVCKETGGQGFYDIYVLVKKNLGDSGYNAEDVVAHVIDKTEVGALECNDAIVIGIIEETKDIALVWDRNIEPTLSWIEYPQFRNSLRDAYFYSGKGFQLMLDILEKKISNPTAPVDLWTQRIVTFVSIFSGVVTVFWMVLSKPTLL